MIELIKALGAGLLLGFIFAAIKLPIPAPPALAGIMGIIGIYLGYVVYTTFIAK